MKFKGRVILGAATLALGAFVAAPSSQAATSIDHGTWTGGDSFTTCSGTATNYTCKHVADSRYGFEQGTTPPVCFESTSGLATSTNCYALLPTSGFDSSTTRVVTKGYGTSGGCLTQAPAGTLNAVIRIHSATLGRTFDIPVDITNSTHSTKINGTLNTSDGLTVNVVAHWTHGCEANGEGIWSGSFDVLV
jgi:hypothetical protein